MSAKKWLPNMDLNHDKQIQSLLCYRYTIRHRCETNRNGFKARVKHQVVNFNN